MTPITIEIEVDSCTASGEAEIVATLERILARAKRGELAQVGIVTASWGGARPKVVSKSVYRGGGEGPG